MLGVKGEFYLYAYSLVLKRNPAQILNNSCYYCVSAKCSCHEYQNIRQVFDKMHNVRDTLDTTYSKEYLL